MTEEKLGDKVVQFKTTVLNSSLLNKLCLEHNINKSGLIRSYIKWVISRLKEVRLNTKSMDGERILLDVLQRHHLHTKDAKSINQALAITSTKPKIKTMGVKLSDLDHRELTALCKKYKISKGGLIEEYVVWAIRKLESIELADNGADTLLESLKY